ncbi:Swt1 family HEPN domain-containing protein [Sphingomonas sp. TWP1-3-1]|uniref:Swt1 family HEPN domain-containing protein n=1 Tax=Sphingomonas sp. TWP1-3-1 TaxID=2804612 RepID=UPI003CF519E7
MGPDPRNLVEETLQSERGDEWWSNAVPQSVRENAQKNIDREASEGLPPRSTRPIEYTTFGELNDIIKENWTSFSGIFSRVSKNRVLRVLIRLNHARGPIAHSNLLPEEEAVRLKLAIRDWYKLME